MGREDPTDIRIILRSGTFDDDSVPLVVLRFTKGRIAVNSILVEPIFNTGQDLLVVLVLNFKLVMLYQDTSALGFRIQLTLELYLDLIYLL
eukprot:SAG11_NODE_5141_length_1652_cov_90.587894_1_plen_91_part_00